MLYKEIVNDMVAKLKTYPQIKMAVFGEIMNFFEQNKQFTFALIQPKSTELYTGPNKNLNQHYFTLFVGDQLNKGQTNALDICSQNMELINKFLFDMKTFSSDLILNMDTITITQDFYSQDEECFISICEFGLTTTASTTPPCV